MIAYVHRDGFDRYGDPVAGEPVEHRNVVWWPRYGASPSSNEAPGELYTTTTTTRLMRFNPGADVQQGDNITIGSPTADKRWHVIGEPFDWESPLTGARPGLVAEVEAVS